MPTFLSYSPAHHLLLVLVTGVALYLLRDWGNRSKRNVRGGRRRKSNTRRLAVQTLESRTLLSATALVAHWEFSEGTGTEAADASEFGENNPATLQAGVGWVEGAVQFDGEPTLISVEDTPDINTAAHAERTVVLRFRADDIDDSSHKQLLYEEGGFTKGLNEVDPNHWTVNTSD